MLIDVTISRRENNKDYVQTYTVKLSGKRTALGVLQEIYAQQDPTLAFRFGCRFKHCGLCSMQINGKAYPACLYEAEGDLELGPLKGFPVLQDLVVDRQFYSDIIRRQGFELNPVPLQRKISYTRLYKKLISCTECYCCLAECPRFSVGSSFPGPLYYVKLAQAYLNPFIKVSLPAYIEKDLLYCFDCRRCFCPHGLPLSAAMRLIGKAAQRMHPEELASRGCGSNKP